MTSAVCPDNAANGCSAPDWVTWHGRGANWQVHPAWRQRLLQADGLPLARWLREGQAQVVKQGQHRTVYRIDLAGDAVYVKHYHPTDRWSIWRTWLRSAPRREAARAAALAAHGVATAQPLAMGEARTTWLGAGEQFLITAAIQQTTALDSYLAEELPRLSPRRQVTIRRELTLALADWCARLHAAGVRHNDLHLGNILLRHHHGQPLRDSDGRVQLFLIDVPGIRLGRPLGWRATRDNLVMLLSGAHSVTTAGERLRFWQEYRLKRRDLAISGHRETLADLERRRQHYARRLLRSRDKRAWRTNRDFHGLSLPAGRGQATSDVSSEELASLLRQPETLLASGWGDPLKLSLSTVVVRTCWNLASGPLDVVVKRWSRKGGLARLYGRWQTPRAAWAWQAGHALLARGIDTPRPRAVVLPADQTAGQGYLVTEWLPGAVNLHEYLWRLANLPPHTRRRQADRCAEAVGRLLGRMHRWRVLHRDLKGANLAVVDTPEACRVYLLDTDGIRIGRWPHPRQQLANLTRLGVSLAAHPWVSRTTVARFWRAYFGQVTASAESRTRQHQVLRDVQTAVSERRRQGKPLW